MSFLHCSKLAYAADARGCELTCGTSPFADRELSLSIRRGTKPTA